MPSIREYSSRELLFAGHKARSGELRLTATWLYSRYPGEVVGHWSARSILQLTSTVCAYPGHVEEQED
jgi:hypothetical protein